MDERHETTRGADVPVSARDLSRRTVLWTVAAGAAVLPAGAVTPAYATPADGFGAPLAEIHVPAGVLSPEQKGAMIKGVSDVLVKAMKVPPERLRHLWVQIFETTPGGWGVGGQVFVAPGKPPAQTPPKT
jgi:phenylpyruvate tautomerase PptA (4-oxalocrotonate tautomerase family)